MRKAVIGLGLFLVAACAESSEKGDSESGRSAPRGEAESGGSAAERGGSTSSGGDAATAGTATGASSTGGSASGGAPRGGATQGGNANPGGSGGSGAEASGEGGADDGTAGSPATGGLNTSGSGGRSGVSGSGGSSGDPTCDPPSDELDNTPYPDCRARDASDPCELCIEASCCEDARTCYGYEPGNVCGWGGPTSGLYAGLNEIDCFVACVQDYVEENGAYGDAADDRCIPRCTTETCGLIGKATLDLVACLRTNCQDDCF